MQSHTYRLAQILLVAMLVVTVAVGVTSRGPQGVVSHWVFDEAHVQNGLVRDTVGGLDTTVSGPVKLHKSDLTEALALDGVTNSLLISDDIASLDLPREQMTVEAWAMVQTRGNWGGFLGAVQDNNSFEKGWILGYRSQRFYFGVSTVGADDGDGELTYLESECGYDTGRWYHVVGTYDGTTQRIYVNGKLEGESQVQSGEIIYPPTAFYEMGAYHDDDEYFRLEGKLKEIRLHNRALTAEEVLANLRQNEMLAAAAREVTLAGFQDSSDWPAYMHDNARSGVTAATVALPLAEEWVYTAPAVPKPAWPDPQVPVVEGRLDRPRMKFDDAFHVAVIDNAVYFGSSVDNKVYSVDAASGQTRWTFFTEGPVRLAPTVCEGRVYVGSDDGYVYCLDADDGELIWKFRGAASAQRLLGSGKMISLWPVRTGVVVDSDIAYFGAGVFPGERVYVYAISAEDGSLIWKNDTVGDRNAGQGDFTPQGYLLASGQYLFVPSGRIMPAAFDRKEGRLLSVRSGLGASWGFPGHTRIGGTYALLCEDLMYTGNQDTIVACQQKSGSAGFAWFPGRRLVVMPKLAYLLDDKGITAIDRAVYKQQKTDKSNSGVKESTIWRYEHTGFCSMIAAGELLILGGEDEVIVTDRITGEELWSAPVHGRANGLAVAGGRLFVSTDKGGIHCFGTGTPASVGTTQIVGNPYRRDKLTPVYERAARTILAQSGVRKGYCLVLGCGTGRLAYELAKHSQLMIYGIEPDAKKVAAARAALDSAGLYGTRVCIDHGDLDALPYSDYFANLVVSDNALVTDRLQFSASEAHRVLKPCGGVLLIGQSSRGGRFFQTPSETRLSRWASAGDFDDDYEVDDKAGVTWLRYVRGPLKGAGSWTHQYGGPGNTASSDDRLVKCPLGVLWYGEPGANQFPSRHDRNVAPLSINGRVFVQGVNMEKDEHHVTCFDAYNGMQYWRRVIPDVERLYMAVECSNLACNEDSLFVATGVKCLRLDVASGRTKSTYEAPSFEDGKAREWAYVAVVGDLLFGSTFNGPQYSDSVFAVDIESGERLWIHRGEKIRNNTICLSEGRMLLADDRVTSEQRQKTLQPKQQALAANPDIDEAGAEKELSESDVRMVVALDTATGQKLWERPLDLTGCSETRPYWWTMGPDKKDTLSAICHDGVLLFIAAHVDGHAWCFFLAGDYSYRRGVALSAEDGSLLWSKSLGYKIRPLVIGDTIYAEPWAFDLHTGEQKMRTHPVTGKPVVWEFQRPGHHCGMISGCPNTLLFRSFYTGYYDLVADEGVSHFAGYRPGCWLNQIPANGLVIQPEASSGCTCMYSMQSTIVFQPREQNKAWGIFTSRTDEPAINHLALNLGAPGDRRDADGTLWLGYPRPSSQGQATGDVEFLRLEHKLKVSTLPGGGYFSNAVEYCSITGTDTRWLYSSGCSGVTEITVPLPDEYALYTVRLGFADTENSKCSQRVFDIKMQDNLVRSNFDAVRAAGGGNKAVVEEFKGIEVHDNLKIEFIPKAEQPSATQVPVLSSIEITKEGEIASGLAVEG